MAEPTSVALGTPAVVSLSGTSAQSAALGTAQPGQPNLTQLVRVVATEDAWLAVGADPTAASETDGSFFMPAGIPEYIDVPAGEKIAGVGSGVLSITPCGKR